MSKSIFKSKTFWLNVAALAVHVAGILPAQYAVPIAAIGNIVVRLFTDQAVTVLS